MEIGSGLLLYQKTWFEFKVNLNLWIEVTKNRVYFAAETWDAIRTKQGVVDWRHLVWPIENPIVCHFGNNSIILEKLDPLPPIGIGGRGFIALK
jgi:hypothetical protein